MTSSFIYQPHVHQSNDGIVTPDIAINRVYIFEGGRHSAVPVSHLTSHVVIQKPGNTLSVMPVVALIEAGFGMLVSIGVACPDSLLVSRKAWRYQDISEIYGNLTLRSRTIQGVASRVDNKVEIGELPCVADIMEALGNRAGIKPGTAVFIMKKAISKKPVVADHYEVTLEDPRRCLAFAIEIQPIH